MVIVMPSFPETENAHQEVVATLIARLVFTASPEMTDTVHAPGDMMNHEDPDQTAPEESQECPGPGVGHYAGDSGRKKKSQHDPYGKQAVNDHDTRIGEQVRGVALLVGPGGVGVEKPSHVGVDKSLDCAQDTGLPAHVR